MNTLRAILPNPADPVLTRTRMADSEAEMRARFASVFAAARGTPVKGTQANPEAKLSEADRRFLKETIEPVRAQARELESFLYLKVLSTMRKTLSSKDNILHGGSAEDTYSMLLDVERAKSMGGPAGSSLAESIARDTLTWGQRRRLEAIDEALARPELKRPTDGPK